MRDWTREQLGLIVAALPCAEKAERQVCDAGGLPPVELRGENRRHLGGEPCGILRSAAEFEAVQRFFDCAAIAERCRRAVCTGDRKFAVIPVFRAYLARTVRTQRRAVLFGGKDPTAQDTRPVE